ncbi:hypothetical protein SEA_FUNSIZED_89 [Mycobacterium phage Funsized]|nr:hypothetical protein SEA_FUNSIZED_89 [Mycobacterium phage Funsized]
MAHDIDNTDGKFSFADSRDDAWHGLGQKVGHTMTPEEALKAAHMWGWNVRKEPLVANVEYKPVNHPLWGEVTMPVETTMSVAVEGKFVVLRDNPHTHEPEPLGVVGRFFQPTQNEETTGLLMDITESTGAPIETIGALNGGRQTFVTMKMPQHIELEGRGGFRDTTEVYIAVLNNHDGEGKLRAVISPIRIVCANTQRLAEQRAVSQVALRHTSGMGDRLAEVRRLLGITFRYIDVFQDEMNALIQAERDDEWVRGVLNDVFDLDGAESERAKNSRIERVSSVMELMRQSPSIAPVAGTAYAGYNAVTEFVDHFMPVNTKGDKAKARALRTVLSPEAQALKGRAATAFTKHLHTPASALISV